MPGTTRCIAHGGSIQLAAGLKESLYSKRLRQSFKQPEDQKLFDELPKGADLSEEIKVQRMRVIRYQDLLESGTDVIFVKEKPKQGSLAHAIAAGQDVDIGDGCKTVALNVHDLLREALQSLRALAATQHDLHPGSDIGGNLRVTITLAGARQPKQPIPDLTDDSSAQRLLPAVGSHLDVEDVRPVRPSDGGESRTGYEDDEP